MNMNFDSKKVVATAADQGMKALKFAGILVGIGLGASVVAVRDSICITKRITKMTKEGWQEVYR